MIEAARWFFLVFAAVTAIGGVIGFVKAKSKPSLIAGIGSGVLLAIASTLVGAGHVVAGLAFGAVLSLALAGRFVPQFRKSGKVMPAGLVSLFAIAGIVIGVAGIAMNH